MINRLAKAQKSWIAKFILILTAVSFMSLFGVSSYLGSAGNNRTVIKVDNIEISQAQFSYALQKELNSLKNFMGPDDEITEDIRAGLINSLAQKMVQESVMDRTEQKYHLSFRPDLIRAIIVNDPSFKDLSGNFNRDMFRRALSDNNMSEEEYINFIKRELAQKILVTLPVLNLNVPDILLQAEGMVDNKRRTFKYVSVKPAEVKIDRQMSDEEIEQYYEDFNTNFIEPERRDLSVVYLSMPEIAERMEITPEEIQAYYDDHKSEFETPETRNILQMMFSDEKEANKAFFELQNGADFYNVAATLANQSREDTDLGYAAADELSDDASTEVFALNTGEYTKPMPNGDMWQIMQVADIKAGQKMPFEEASKKIVEELKGERLYDDTYALINQIDDKIGAGADLSAIAAELNLNTAQIKGLADDGSAKVVPAAMTSLAASPDFIDTAFSYALNETSQVMETDEGIALIRVDNIAEAHPKPLNDVREEIKHLWAANEKTAIAQEQLNDIMHDLENGDDLSDVAKRYNLPVYKSQPITRNETFGGVNYADIREMFAEPLKTPRQIQQGENYIVAVAVNDYKNSAPLSENEQELIRRTAYQSLVRDFGEAMLASYAKDYKIRVKYKLMGLDDL